MHKNKLIFSFIGLIMLLSLITSCLPPDEIEVGQELICDCEELNKEGNKFIGKGGKSKLFDGGKNKTSLEARSGKFSVLTSPDARYAFGHGIKNTNSDWYFKISVWRKSNKNKGFLVAAAKNPEVLYVASDKVSKKEDNGWEKIEIDVFTPLGFNMDNLKVYVWNNTDDTIYFDDLKIERLKFKKYPDYKMSSLSVYIDTSDYIKIQKKRQKAFKNGILQSSDDDWVKGIVVEDDRIMKSKMRLKGDWLDHLNGEKWSFRIKLKKSFAWNGMRTFSIQTPLARGYLYEWVAHELYRDNDLLTTRYGFIPVFLNNQSKGMYAWEEHFEKQLLESSKRREGPILKFGEDAFWQDTKVNSKLENKHLYAPYQSSVIQPFGSGRLVDSPGLYNQFLNAQKLMNQYKNHTKAVADIFDVKKLASYFALLDLSHANHSRAWHNQRMYYNPVICKLEPIAFDGFGEKHTTYYGINGNYAYRILNTRTLNQNEYDLITFIFKDRDFVNLYLGFLKEYSSEEYILQFTKDRSESIHYYDSLLSMEFPFFDYEYDWLSKSARDIRNYLPEFEKFLSNYIDNEEFELITEVQNFKEVEVIEDTPEYFVNAYVKEKKSDSLVIEVFNYYPNEILILGTGRKKKYIEFFEHPEPKVGAFDGSVKAIGINTDTSSNYLFFMTKGSNETFVTEINKWPLPSGNTAQQQLMELVNLDDRLLIDTIIDDRIYIKGNKLDVRKPFIIPSGYTVFFKEGTIMDITSNAMFISYSPVKMMGTQHKPIIITSSDFTANGFTVIQGELQSEVQHVVFENLNTLNYKGWVITGAVNFYESDVSINSTRFYRNQCEDALNIIRSEFIVENCKFDNIYADAFDSDFCSGLVKNTQFNQIGNDAIDFSGSQIRIEDTEIVNAKDKGISGGEDSFLQLKNVNIYDSNIGIASKDKSIVEVENANIGNCNYGLVLLQKKPEYGPASMKLRNCKIINPKQRLLIELGSKIDFDGEIIIGDTKNVAEMFY